MYCPKCGKPISDDSAFCRYCGQSTSILGQTTDKSVTASNQTYSQGSSDKKKLVYVLVSIIIVIGIVFAYNNILFGDDKIAYDMVVKASSNFKDPSSVRLTSGTLSQDKTYLFCGINAKNGFGARGTSYYSISSSGIILESDSPGSLEMSHNDLNIDKINKALERHFGSD